MRTLDRYISIERKTVTLNAFGDPIESWAAIDAERPASVAPVGGDERFTSAQFIARQQVEFTLRWSSNIADLTPLDRIIYPAGAIGGTTSGDYFGNSYFGKAYFGPSYWGSDAEVDASADDSQIFDIIQVSEVGRRQSIKIIAARRPDA